jgi:hypothetical protein
MSLKNKVVDMVRKEAKHILNRYPKGMCSPKEVLLIECWYLETVATSDYRVSEDAEALIMQRIWNKIQLDKKPIPIYKNKFIRLIPAAAAAVILAIAYTMLFNTNQPSDEKATHISADILPGGVKATLTLDNGREINLSVPMKGLLAVQHGANITKTDSSIVYQTINDGNGSDTNIVATPRGGQFQIKLPDGSLAYLNADTRLTYPTRFTGTKRQVCLQGEAYFEIEKNAAAPFEVLSTNQITRVLGTIFNVSCYPGEQFRTILVKGAVEVINTKTKIPTRKLLKAGQQATLDSSGIFVTNVNPTKAIAWKNGQFDFNQTPLAEALHQISRWYSIRVDYSNLPDTKVTAILSKTLPLSELLDALNTANNIELIRKDSIISIN